MIRSTNVVLRSIASLWLVLLLCTVSQVPSMAAAIRLDEATSVLIVEGTGRPPSDVDHPVQARLMAERAAIVDAYAAAARLLSSALSEARPTPQGYALFLRGATVVDSEVMPDASVRVTLEVAVSGDLLGSLRGIIKGRSSGEQDQPSGISYRDHLIRHRIPGPGVITAREWADRYRTGNWVRRAPAVN